MVTHLYSDFLDDPAEYEAAERFWMHLWHTQIDPHGLHREWVSWINTRFGDGTPVMDGNPIFSRISSANGRAIRVVQNEVTSDDLKIDFWLNQVMPEPAQSIGPIELVISCELSIEAAQYAAELMFSWVHRGELRLESEFARIGYADEGVEECELASGYPLVA
jgi:hypothetical protein